MQGKVYRHGMRIPNANHYDGPDYSLVNRFLINPPENLAQGDIIPGAMFCNWCGFYTSDLINGVTCCPSRAIFNAKK